MRMANSRNYHENAAAIVIYLYIKVVASSEPKSGGLISLVSRVSEIDLSQEGGAAMGGDAARPRGMRCKRRSSSSV
ncbi:unnamed protein product [Linum tenue]|uniref:Uncharacterized protein n=1 Tax=Linum tenue TaxID=586396 RepID=A0AAV0NSF1_9ROSI|nr:unnamed protein product [Linum tenue]